LNQAGISVDEKAQMKQTLASKIKTKKKDVASL
jgi:hypothetical protein